MIKRVQGHDFLDTLDNCVALLEKRNIRNDLKHVAKVVSLQRLNGSVLARSFGTVKEPIARQMGRGNGFAPLFE
jgi:hypothetical protein